MKKLIVMAATAVLFTSVSVSTFAAGRSFEGRCKAQAEKYKISTDKMDAFVKECVEKHEKWMKRKYNKAGRKKEMNQTPENQEPIEPALPVEPTK